VRIGAHVSTAEALHLCVDRACAIDCEAIQIFAAAPQSWRPRVHSDDALALLQQRATACDVVPVFVHGSYLINLATADPALLQRSLAALRQSRRFCETSGASGTIFHVGSHKGAGFAAVRQQVVEALRQVLDDGGQSLLILENSAGTGNTLAARFAEIGALIADVGSDRLRVCIDTCHAFASGYDVSTPAGVDRMVEELDREIGSERLVAVHANDSKGPFACGKDRHENIGAGFIGLDGFRAIMAHPVFQDVPFLLEVPGFAGKGPDKENVAILKRLREEVCG